MTLNGVMAVILRYFSEFVYLPGVLHKSSRSLSHLLMSFCNRVTQRRSYASAVLRVVILSVCPSARLSVCHTCALWLIQRT